MISWDDISKFMSGFAVPILFVIVVALFFLFMIMRKYRIESWEDLKNLVRFTVIENENV
jgi:preprotein translocase subunit YajC